MMGKRLQHNQSGIAALIIIVMIVAIIIVGSGTYVVTRQEQFQEQKKEPKEMISGEGEIQQENKTEKNYSTPPQPSQPKPAPQEPPKESEKKEIEKPSSPPPAVINWTFDFYNQYWKASDNPPSCPSPLFIQTPVDVSKVIQLLYPGQYRGGDYKTHGGFRFNSAQNAATVRAPMDAYIWRASRYIQDGETQYLFFFINPCGVMYKFDHLLELAPKLQAIADSLPPAKPDDSRTTDVSERITVKAGEILATEIGIKNTKNVFVDFGVYDLRTRNKASKNPDWAAEHQRYRETEFYALCFLDVLPLYDASVLKTLPSGNEGKTSDYCASEPARSEGDHSPERYGYGMKPAFYNSDGLSAQFYWPGEESFSSDETEILLFNQTGSDMAVTYAEMKFSVNGNMYPIFSGTWEKFPSVQSWNRIEYINIGKGTYTGNLALENGRKGKLHWHIDFGGEALSGPQKAKVKITLVIHGQIRVIEQEFNRDSGVISKESH